MPPYFIKRFWSKIKPLESGCWVWTGCKLGNGYGRMRLKGRQITCHRLMYQITSGPIPDEMMVLHSCDNRLCVNPNHLRLGTHSDNMADAARKNRMMQKLNFSQVREIRRLHTEGFSQGKIAKMFGVSQTTARLIICGERRYHVE